MVNQNTIDELADGYRRLIESQKAAPPYQPRAGQRPYNMPYYVSESAADERWQYWHNARYIASDDEVFLAQRAVQCDIDS
jgi:hypothetical protein